MRFRALGGLHVDDDGVPLDLGGPKQRAVLAVLLLAAGAPVPAEAVAERVWGDDLPSRYDASLQAYISNLRRALEPDRTPRSPAKVLLSKPSGYCLAIEAVDLDVTQIEQLLADAGRARTAGQPVDALRLLDSALAMWSGPLLPEFAGSPWVDAAAVRLEALRHRARVDRAEIVLAGPPTNSDIVGEVESLVADQPYDEHGHSLLALARYRFGRQRDALEGLQAARRMLLDDIGIEPGPEMKQMERDILSQAEHLRPALPRPSEPGPLTEAVQLPASPETRRSRSLSTGFFGRVTELAQLRDAGMSVRADGSGAVVIVNGEPGVGKTRLVEQAVLTHFADYVVAWGRCPESAINAPYRVASQVLRQIAGSGAMRDDTVDRLFVGIGDDGLDSASRRLELYDQVTRALSGADRPIAIVVDDLQWADLGSLRLIEHLAGELRELPLLLIVTVRPARDESTLDLVRCLAELARQPNSIRVDLGGLTADDVSTWLEFSSGTSPPTAVIEAVHRRTDGNAFFVEEVVSLIGRGASADAVPAAVHDAVRRHVSALPPDTQQLLSNASVLGREVAVQLLAAVTERESLTVLDQLEPALQRGLLQLADRPGFVRFNHAITAEALSAEVGPAKRARIHARAATALHDDRRHGVDDANVVDLAHHAYLGMAAGSAELAGNVLIEAAEIASDRLADDDALVLLSRALEALHMHAPGDRARRTDVLIAQGQAAVRLDDIARAAQFLVAAIRLALEFDDLDRAAKAARSLGVAGIWQAGEVVSVASAVTGALEAVRGRLAPASPHLPAVLALICDYGYWFQTAEAAEALSAEAVALARATGDTALLAFVLKVRLTAIWRASLADQRRHTADELLAVTERAPLPAVLRAGALMQRAGVAYAFGDIDEAERLIEQVEPMAATSVGLRTQTRWFSAGLALWRGHLDVAAASLAAGTALSRREGASDFHAAFSLPILLEQDRIDDLVAAVDLVTGGRFAASFSAVVGFVLIEASETERAFAVAKAVPSPSDSWFSPAVDALSLLNQIVFDNHTAVRELIGRLEPLSGLLANSGSGPAFGDADFALARGFRFLGDVDRADEALDRSIALLTRSGSGPWLVRALMHRAETTGRVADLEAARSMVDRLDLPLLRRRLENLSLPSR